MGSKATSLCQGRCFVALAFFLVLSGCSGDQYEPGQTESNGPVQTESSNASPSPEVETEALPTVVASVDPNNPVPRVIRPEATGEPKEKADQAPIKGTVSYADGVSISVTDIELGTEKDHGPGAVPDRPYAVFTLKATNGTVKPLPLNAVVVRALDKTNHLVAPVYDRSARAADFGVDLEPGKSVEARYAFAVKTDSHDQVMVVVDFDATHSSAVFSGAIS